MVQARLVVEEVAHADGSVGKVGPHRLPQPRQILAGGAVQVLDVLICVFRPRPIAGIVVDAGEIGLHQAALLVVVKVIAARCNIPVGVDAAGAPGDRTLLVLLALEDGDGVVLPGEGGAVFQGVGQLQIDIVVPRLVGSAVVGTRPFIDDGPVQVGEQGDLLGVVQGGELKGAAVIGTAQIARHRQRGHILGVRHPVYHPKHVKGAAGAQHGQGGHRDHAPLPGPQHPEGFFQQHLRRKIACGGPEQHAQGQGQGEGVVHPAEEGGRPGPEAQPGAQGDAVFEDRPHQGDGHHVPRRLHMAVAIDHQGQHRQHHPGGGIGGHGGGGGQIPFAGG